jgi:dihydroorotase
MSTILIQNGRLIDPASQLDAPRDLLLRDGLVAAVSAPGTLTDTAADTILDATNCIVAPGFVDMHVHLREPGQTYKETIATATSAAAAGGYTTVVAMPNTIPTNDNVDTMRWMLAPERGPRVRLFAMGAATLGSLGVELSDYTALAQAGAVGFTDDGKPVLDPAIMRTALASAGSLGLAVSQHSEDPARSNGAVINAGPVAFRLGLRGYPAEAESSIIERDIGLVREIVQAGGQAYLHVQHVSTSLSMAAIRAAKQEGLPVTCEVAPHHFTLTDEAVGDFDTNAKVNPPLRSESDRQAILSAILDGTVDCIATDHAPHARHEKEVEFERAPNGLTGLETALGLALRVLYREHGVPLTRIVGLLSTNPGRILKLSNAGSLKLGAWADVVIFNPSEAWRFDVSASCSMGRNTPFDGAEMLGRVKSTIVAGEAVYGG